jgi:hypothetical protein
VSYVPPVVGFPITSDFYAPRSYGIHAATDYGCPIGTPVHAIGDGVVKERTSAVDAGRYISVDHPGGLRSRYLHLSQWKVVVGQIITRGQVVGISGNTGTATYGPHLHHDCSFKTLAEARQIQSDPVQHLSRWRVNPEVLFSLQEEDDMYLLVETDGTKRTYIVGATGKRHISPAELKMHTRASVPVVKATATEAAGVRSQP